jgi:hypothetical protein
MPFLEVVGHPVAVNPDRDLRRVARDRGWETLEFSERAYPHARRGVQPAFYAAVVLLAAALYTVKKRGS